MSAPFLAAMASQAMQDLQQCGGAPDRRAVRRRADPGLPRPGAPRVVLATACLGNTCLKDNLRLEAAA